MFVWSQFVVEWAVHRTPERLKFVAGGAVFLVAVVHLFRVLLLFRSPRAPADGRPPAADYYRISDAVRRGEAVADPALARTAQTTAERQLRSSRFFLFAWPVVVVLQVVQLFGPHFATGRLAWRLVFLAWLTFLVIRSAGRPSRLAEAAERNRQLADAYERESVTRGGEPSWN